jgi:hypothetical protein
MKVVFLVLLVLSGWACAADGDSDLLYAKFVEIDDETTRLFQAAACNSYVDSLACDFPGTDIL